MRHIFKIAAAGVAAFVLSVGTASAATVFVGQFDGNDPFPDDLMGSPALAKCDDGAEGNHPIVCDNWLDGGAEGDYSNAFSLTYDSESSFDWSFDGSLVTGTTDVLIPLFIAIKAGSDYLVYELTEGELSGSIDISNIDEMAISHVSFYDTGTPEIPIPAAIWLMGAGLAGLGFAGRRKKQA